MKRLKRMTDDELAAHMSGWKPGTRQYILCEQEFQRRHGAPNARRSWIAIGIALAALAVSALSYCTKL